MNGGFFLGFFGMVIANAVMNVKFKSWKNSFCALSTFPVSSVPTSSNDKFSFGHVLLLR